MLQKIVMRCTDLKILIAPFSRGVIALCHELIGGCGQLYVPEFIREA
jgi:hypothetical protein